MSKKVLILDDSADLRTIFSVILRHSGYETVECADAQTAAIEIQINRPNLVVIDGSVGNADGWALAASLNAQNSSSVRIIVLEEYELDSRRPQKLLVDKILRKPVEPRALLQVVDNLLRDEQCDAASGA